MSRLIHFEFHGDGMEQAKKFDGDGHFRFCRNVDKKCSRVV